MKVNQNKFDDIFKKLKSKQSLRHMPLTFTFGSEKHPEFSQHTNMSVNFRY